MSTALDLPFVEPPEWSCPRCSSGGHIDCEIEEWPDPDDIPDEEAPF